MRDALRELKDKLEGHLGKGVESLPFWREGRPVSEGPARQPASRGGEGNKRDDAQHALCDEWQTYVRVATMGRGEEARLKQLMVVLAAYDALCRESVGTADPADVGERALETRVDVNFVLGKDNSFCAELATIACAEMEKLEWQLEANSSDSFEDAVSASSHRSSGTNCCPSLLQLLHILASIQWHDKDIRAFQRTGLLEVLISALSDRLLVDKGCCLPMNNQCASEDEQVSDRWVPSALDEAMWMLTGKLLLHGSLVRDLVDVERGKEAVALLFDMATLDGCTSRQCWSRAQAVSALRFLVDYGSPTRAMSGYLQAYGCIGKVLQRLLRNHLNWATPECVKIIGAVVRFVHTLAPFSSKFISDFENGEGCMLIRKIILRVQQEAVRQPAREGRDGALARQANCQDADVNRLGYAVGLLGKLVILNDEPSTGAAPASWAVSPESGAPCVKPDGGSEADADKCRGEGAVSRDSAAAALLQRRLGSKRALDTLIEVFEEAVQVEAREAALQTLLRVYGGHPANYRLLSSGAMRPQAPAVSEETGLARLIRTAHLYEVSAAEAMMQAVRHVCAGGNRPVPELRAISDLIAKDTPLEILLVVCKTLHELSALDARFRDLARELGILEALLASVHERYARAACSGPLSSGVLQWGREPHMRLDALLIETIQVLCRGSRQNSQAVRRKGLPCFLQLVWIQDLHGAVLRLMCQIAASGDHDDVEACVAGMCEVLHSHHGNVQAQAFSDESESRHRTLLSCEIFVSLTSMMESEAARSALRLYEGFELVLSVLRQHGQTQHGAFKADSVTLIARAVSLLAVSTHDSAENHEYLWQKVGIDAMHALLEDADVLSGPHSTMLLESLLGMACGKSMCLLNIADHSNGNDCVKAMTWKAEALVLLISLCGAMSEEDAIRMLTAVSCIASARPDNAQELAEKGAIAHLLSLLVHGPENSEIRERIVELVESIGSVRLEPLDARRLLHLCWDANSRWRTFLLPVVRRISDSQCAARLSSSYIRFSMEISGYASAEIQVEKQLAWPPSAGYTVAFWLCVEDFGTGPIHLLHLSAQPKTNIKDSHSTAFLLGKYAKGQLSIQIEDTDEIQFSSFTAVPGAWYHVVLVHVQNKVQKSEASLFVNGHLREVGKLKMARISSVIELLSSAPAADLTIFLGLPNNVQPQEPSSMQWKMRGVVLIEEPLAGESILAMCRCGHSYDGCYLSEPHEGEVGEMVSAVATAWRYAALDSEDFEDAPPEVSRSAAKISWDKLVFASKLLDARGCRDLVVGKFPGTLQRTLGRGGVQNLKECAWTGKLGWLRGDAAVVSALAFADALRSIGGVTVLLAIIETCANPHELVTMLQILKGVLWRNALNLVDMTHVKGYQVVAGFLQRRPDLITREVVDELMHLAGFGHSTRNGMLVNAEACQHLILNTRTWRNIDPGDAAKIFQGLRDLLSCATARRREANANALESIALVPFLCFCLHQPHLIENTGMQIVGTLESFLAVNLGIQPLNLLAQLLLDRPSGSGPSADHSPEHRVTRSSCVSERPWLRVELLAMLLRLVESADAQRLASLANSFEPMWFAVMFQQGVGLEGTLALLQILTVLLCENEGYRKAFQRANAFLPIASQLHDFHWSTDLYFSLFLLMFAAHVKRKVRWQGLPYSADKLRNCLSLSSEACATVPEVFPLILRLLKLNIQLEIATRTSCAKPSAGGSAFASQLLPTASSPRAAALKRHTSAGQLAEMNCVTVQALRQLYDNVLNVRGLCVSDESVEALVNLVFLVSDDVSAAGPESPGAVSKMTGAVIKGLGKMLRIAGADVHEDDKSAGGGWMTKLQPAAADQQPAAKAAAAAALAAAGPAAPLESYFPADSTEDDGWEDLGGGEGIQEESVEAEAGFLGGDTDVEHVATVQPVPSAAEDGSLDFHSGAGELVFHMLCRVVEGGIHTPALGAGIVSSVLESIPLAVSPDDERLFGGVIISQVCKLLHKNSKQIDVRNGELVKQLVLFCEMITDFVCADSFAVNYRELMEFATFVMQHLQAAEATGYIQDSAFVAKHLGALHKTTNRVILHLLSHLQQAPDRLSTFVQALGDHVNVVFGAHNTDAPMLVLIAHAVFGFFLSEDMPVRHSAMRVWGHLLEHRRAVIMPLLTYCDADGTPKSLFSDGFHRLVVSGVDVKSCEYDAKVAVAISEFDEWLLSPLPGAKVEGSTRVAHVAALVHDNAAKQRVKVLSLEQQYHVEVQKRHYKCRQTRLHRSRKRMADEEEARCAMQDEAQEAERKAVAQWRKLVRSHWQNLESRSVFTQQQWERDKEPLFRERGVLGQAYSDLETCAWRCSKLARAGMEGGISHGGEHSADGKRGFGGRRPARNVGAHFSGMPSVVTWLAVASPEASGTRVECARRACRLQTVWQGRAGEAHQQTHCAGGKSGSNLGCDRLWWRLDQTEGPQRLRRRLQLDVGQLRNPTYEFDAEAHGYRPIKAAHKRQPSRGAGGFWEAKEEQLEPAAIAAHLKYEGGGGGESGWRADKEKGRLMSSLMTTLLGASDSGTSTSSDQNAIDHDKFVWALDSSDDILAVHNCMRLFSGTTVSGVLLVCTHHIYVFDQCHVLDSGEVRMFKGASGQPAGAGTQEGREVGYLQDDQAVGSPWESHGEMAVVHRWNHSEIRDLQRRKYLLRPVGVEMFTNDGLDCLLIFHKSERDHVYDKIMSVRQEALAKMEAAAPEEKKAEATHTNLGEAALDLTNASQTSELAQGRWTGRSSRKTLLQNLRRLWQEGDISNLQYLMHLNTLAGRSYNDLTQYPVFPWVLRDYTSEHLDLTNPNVFRDLSKPMGAQDDARAEEYRKRFENWLEPDEEHPTPPFHYATHYSSAAAVTFYLIRLEPFTSVHVRLQGGKFDHADRIFSSVHECWESASKLSLSDVKELIPEFYYMPDLFVNFNRLSLGTRQKTCKLVSDVHLPPWAHGSPDEFVRKMRMALESEHVSAHLHEWIDLIFGHRQRGPAAAESLNVFHHLTYEGNVDVDTIVDPVERMSTIAQILNFGQTPTQLFDKPHPRREAGISSALATQFCTDPSAVESTVVRDAWRGGEGAVRDARIGQDGKVVVVCGKRMWCMPSVSDFFTWGHQDGSLRFVSVQRSVASVKKTESEKLVACYESLHQGAVTAAAASEDGSIIVTGSSFGDMIVWRTEVRPAPPSSGTAMGAVTAGIHVVRGTEKTVRLLHLRRRLCAHIGKVTCLTVSSSHAVMLSGSEDGTVILWDACRLRFIRQLISDLKARPDCVDLNQTASMVVVAAGHEIRVVNINGSPLARLAMRPEDNDAFVCARAIRSPEWAAEYPVLVSGHASGAIRFWKLMPKRLSRPHAPSDAGCAKSECGKEKLALHAELACTRSHEAAVTSISFSADGHQMLTGDAEGTVNVWGRDKKSTASRPKWLVAAPRPSGSTRLDERLLRCISVKPIRVERSEAEGGKLISSDFSGPAEFYVMACLLASRELPACMTRGQQGLTPSLAEEVPKDITWETRRTFAQFAELHVVLQRHGGVAGAVLPPKKPSVFMTGSSEDQSGERERQEGLACFLTVCLRQCTVRQAAVLCAFIEAPDPLYDLAQSLRSEIA